MGANWLDNADRFHYNIIVARAAMAQQVEHVLGKDEVTGSNPVSSSIKERKRKCLRSFFIP